MVHDAGPRAGRLERMRARFGERADAVVFGHSHLPLHERADGFQIFNPGSPTDRRRAPATRWAWPASTARRVELRADQVNIGGMDLDVLFLGTAGSAPSARRGLPATLVRRGGDRLLFDCGEGTQRQLVRSIGLVELEEIFITHFHADHVLGLPGMLKTFALRQRERALTVYGPRRPARAVRGAAPAHRPGRPFRSSCASSSRTTSSSATATGSPPTRSTTASSALGYALVEDTAPGRLRPGAGDASSA